MAIPASFVLGPSICQSSSSSVRSLSLSFHVFLRSVRRRRRRRRNIGRRGERGGARLATQRGGGGAFAACSDSAVAEEVGTEYGPTTHSHPEEEEEGACVTDRGSFCLVLVRVCVWRARAFHREGGHSPLAGPGAGGGGATQEEEKAVASLGGIMSTWQSLNCFSARRQRFRGKQCKNSLQPKECSTKIATHQKV